MSGARLGDLEQDGQGDRWLQLIGKGGKLGRVALPALARVALDRYLARRQIPTTQRYQDPKTPVIGSLDRDNPTGITATRRWAVMKRFFLKAHLARGKG